jgi:hypothetical protein
MFPHIGTRPIPEVTAPELLETLRRIEVPVGCVLTRRASLKYPPGKGTILFRLRNISATLERYAAPTDTTGAANRGVWAHV